MGKGLLTALPSFRRQEAHFPALPYEQVGRTVGLVRESTANLLTKLAFEFLVLTAARSGGSAQCQLGRNPLAQAYLGDSGHQDEVSPGT